MKEECSVDGHCSPGSYCDDAIGVCDKCSILCHPSRGLSQHCREKCKDFTPDAATPSPRLASTTLLPTIASTTQLGAVIATGNNDSFVLFVVIFCCIVIALLLSSAVVVLIIKYKNQKQQQQNTFNGGVVRYSNQRSNDVVTIVQEGTTSAPRNGEETVAMLRNSCNGQWNGDSGEDGLQEDRYTSSPHHHLQRPQINSMSSSSQTSSQGSNNIYEAVDPKVNRNTNVGLKPSQGSAIGNQAMNSGSASKQLPVHPEESAGNSIGLEPPHLNSNLNGIGGQELYSNIPAVDQSVRNPNNPLPNVSHQMAPNGQNIANNNNLVPFPLANTVNGEMTQNQGEVNQGGRTTVRQSSTQTDEGIDCSSIQQDYGNNGKHVQQDSVNNGKQLKGEINASKNRPETTWHQENNKPSYEDDLHPPVSFVRNKHVYDTLRKLPYVQGYYSEGRSIQVFVDADTLDQAWLLSELQNQTGQPPSKFHIRPCDEQDDM